MSEKISDASKTISDINAKNNDVTLVNDTKQKMIDQLNKQEMADIIVKQNNIIGHQSIQMLDLINTIDATNNISSSNRSSDNIKCDKQNELYKQQLNIYNDYILNLLLFILVVGVFIGWLWHLYRK